MYRILTILTLVTCLGTRAELTFTGLTDSAIKIRPEAGTGLEALYVINNGSGMTATYTASSPQVSVEWMRFDKLGGAYGEPVPFTRNGTECTITLGADDIGYIINDNGRQHCYWIVDYENHALTLDAATVNATESDCDMTAIDINGTAPRITYYTINGIPRELSREITVSYNSLEWNETDKTYTQSTTVETITSIGSILRVAAPLCDTDFKISGDRFLKEWNREISVTTPTHNTAAIDARTWTATTRRDSENEIIDAGGELGGSAPVEITFTAATTDAVAYKEWQMSSTPDFEIIDLRFNQDEVIHTFRNFGMTYVRFVCANATGDCDWTSETYQVSIGESKIECPNAFSPGTSDGVNDEWRVSYRSIVTFECHIFNRWGIKLFSTTDPSHGWDGKHGGKIVPAGVYYYVIKARGADGKDYSLAGDINIINYKTGNNRPVNK